MKINFAILLIPLLLLLAGPADASGGWFKVINVTSIEMTANSEANFTVSVKGMGGERAYVELVFRNESEGFEFTCPQMIKNVFPAGVTDYSCSVKAGDVAPGNYTFVVDAAAAGARPGKMTAYIKVVDEKSPTEVLFDSTTDYFKNMTDREEARSEETTASSQPSSQKGIKASADQAAADAPFPGAIFSIIGLLIAGRRIKRQR